MSKVGVHVVQGNRTGYMDFLSRCSAALQPVSVVKAVDEIGALLEARQVDVLTYTIAAFESLRSGFNLTADPTEEAARWWERLMAKQAALSQAERDAIDIYETNNENPGNWKWWADFTIELCQRGYANGIHLCIFNYSTGTPPLITDPEGPTALPEIARACRVALDTGHYLGLHEYGGVGNRAPGVPNLATLRGTEPYHALRYRVLASYLTALDSLPPIILTEVGQAGGHTFIGTQAMIDDIAWYDEQLQNDPHVIGAALWTLGDWAQANIQSALPALADYIISHPDPIDPTPIPPPVNYVVIVNLIPQDTTDSEYDDVRARTKAGRETIVQSADDAKRLVAPGLPGSKVRIWNGERWSPSGSVQPIIDYLGTPFVLERFTATPPPPGAFSCYVGLHMRADGGRYIQGDFDCIDRGQIEVVKVASNHSFDDLDYLGMMGVDFSNSVLRLFANVATDPEMTADKLYNVHRAWIEQWLFLGGRFVEVHNEPNLIVEGLGKPWAWSDATGFADYYGSVSRQIRRDYPGILIGYPGLGPNDGRVEPGVSDGRSNVALWLPTIGPLIDAGLVDWIGAHSYWTRLDQLHHPDHGNYWRRFTSFGKPVLVTEYSEVNAETPRTEKARQYVAWLADLKATGLVHSAFAFVSSASNPDFNARGETWVLPNGSLSGIPGIVGAR